jgi:hypothetical protein
VAKQVGDEFRVTTVGVNKPQALELSTPEERLHATEGMRAMATAAMELARRLDLKLAIAPADKQQGNVVKGDFGIPDDIRSKMKLAQQGEVMLREFLDLAAKDNAEYRAKPEAKVLDMEAARASRGDSIAGAGVKGDEQSREVIKLLKDDFGNPMSPETAQAGELNPFFDPFIAGTTKISRKAVEELQLRINHVQYLAEVSASPKEQKRLRAMAESMRNHRDELNGKIQKQFDTWFEGSKVVDDNGEPLQVFHGTGYKFRSFKKGRAAFFTNDKGYADFFAGMSSTDKAITMEVYLSIKKPLVIDESKLSEDEISAGHYDGWQPYIEKAKAEGHDGLIIKSKKVDGFDPQDEYIIFNSNQVKSVRNSGSYDPAKADILKQSKRAAAGYDQVKAASEELRAAHPGLDFSLTGGSGGVLVLSSIKIPKEMQSQGLGSKFMSDLVAIADRGGFTLAASPSSDFGGTKSRIREWNQRFGFVDNKGRNKDFRISETMYREPRSSDENFSKAGSSERGRVVFTPVEGGPGVKASIDLFTGSDTSTLAHETSHVFGRLLEMLAARPGATEDVKADNQAMLEAMGFKTQAERTAAREERLSLQKDLSWVFGEAPGGLEKRARIAELTAKEERLAYLWEQYLTEGKAPDAALRAPFQRFKSWLLSVYKQVKAIGQGFQEQYGEALGELKPETRQLFDRLLTAEEAVGKANEASGLNPLPGAPEDVKQAYADAKVEAEQRVVRAIVEGDRKANSQMMEDERARLRLESATAIDSDPVQAAVRSMQARPEMALNRAELTKAYGAELVRTIAKEHPGIFAPKGKGISLEKASAELGFDSGADMIDKLSKTRNRDALLEQEVQRKMEALYGPPLVQDPEALASQALDAAATPKAAGAIILEMSRMASELGDPTLDVRSRGVNWQQMVDTAEQMVVTGKVGELSSSKYSNSMQRFAQRAFEAMGKAAEAKTEGQRKAWTRKAYEERDQQLWALAMLKAAEKEKSALDPRADQMKKSAKTGWRKDIGADGIVYADVVDALLEAVGLGSPPADPTGQRGTLDQAIKKAAEDAGAIDFDVEVVRQVLASGTKWKDLTVAQAWEVSVAVANLRTIAKNKNEMNIAGRRVKRGQVLDQMEIAARASLPEQPKFEDDPRLDDRISKGLNAFGQNVDALLGDVTLFANMLDGGNRDGIFHKILIDNRLVARDKRSQLTRDFLEKISASFEKSGLDRSRLYEQLDVGADLPLRPEMAARRTGQKRTRANLIMMLLNLGNDSNAERFLGGYQWSREQVIKVIEKHLNAAEVRWVNDVWKALEGTNGGPSLYEEMARVHMEETGERPEKIVAKPFKITTADGTVVELDGGYFPARYDNRPTGLVTKTGEKQVQDTISAFFSEGYQKGGMKPYSPHAKARAAHFEDVVSLDWGIVPAHVSQVIQDIAFRGYARETAALFLDARFKNLMDERLGTIRGGFFEPWLKAVVNQTSDTLAADLRPTDRFFAQLKSKAATAAIGWSIPVALGDLTQPLTAVATGDIKAKYLALATAKQAANWRETYRFIRENSKEIQERNEKLAHKFRMEISQMGGAAGMEHPMLRGMRDTAFITMEMTDKLTSAPVWMAKFMQSQAEGMSHAESVRAADDTVRRVFPPEDIANRPRILRSKFAGFLLFYGYANKIWNVERQVVHEAWSKWHDDSASVGDKAGAVARAAGTILAVSLVNGVIGEYFSGRGKEDGEDTDEWLERKLVAALFYPLPFIGALGDVVGGKVVAAVHGKDQPMAKVSIRNAPALSMLQDTFTRIDNGVKAWSAGDTTAGDATLHSIELLLGLGLGAPVRQVEKTGKAAASLFSGESSAQGPVDAFGNLIYGENNQDNPTKLIQRKLSE